MTSLPRSPASEIHGDAPFRHPLLGAALEGLALPADGAFAAAHGILHAGGRLDVTGLCGPAAGVYLPLWLRRFLVLVDEAGPAEEWVRVLRGGLSLLGEDPDDVLHIPAPDTDFYHGLPMHAGIDAQRAAGLQRLLDGAYRAAVIPARSFLLRVPGPALLRGARREIRPGEEFARDACVTLLWTAGYRRVDFVEEEGEFSVRGALVDVGLPDESYPVRIEWFGDTVESIRWFEPATQRSLHERETPFVIRPLVEVPRDPELASRWETRMDQSGDARVADFRARGDYAGHAMEVRALEELFAPITVLAGNAPWVVASPSLVEASLARHRTGAELSHGQSGRPPHVAPAHLLVPAALAGDLIARAPLRLDAPAGDMPDRNALAFRTMPSPSYAGRFDDALLAVRPFLEGGGRVVGAARTPSMAARMSTLWSGGDVPVSRFADQEELFAGAVHLTGGDLERGFQDSDLGLWVLSQGDLLGRGEEARAAGRAHAHRAFAGDLRDLRPGDAVVHLEHGIGLFRGMEILERDGTREEFLVLEYQGESRLYVPIERLDLIQKYIGATEARPQPDRLGGEAWKNRKSRARKAAREKAEELVALYARRQMAHGHAFAPDTEWQAQFESQFPYTLTPDQERAVREVKADMEAPRPMDRLVCGDVGYGKTEVAMRAVFKACMEGFQCAVLCPTTVLAFQHEQTFRARFAGFPVRIEGVSRLHPAKQVKESLARLAAGEVDVLIGTHRLLGKDVQFARLGLVVVDEEQRFGVTHKERLKELRTSVDVLTLTATPIPRTMQMGLAGIRDMSVIETAPRDRLAIQTHVLALEDDWIREALLREKERGGQAFFIHNRVEDMESVVGTLRRLAPECRFLFAHGQMPAALLESTMVRFLRAEADVLVATTILENGIDMPRVNTLIVNRADTYGLAQLYQLRGRIGRSDRQAYAFLAVPADRVLTEEARKRLDALRDFSDLGAGFRIAALDLELRGAGALLGTAQSGHLSAIGFDLYMRILEEEVRRLEGLPVGEPAVTEVQLGLDLAVPSRYMPDMGARLRLYKRMAMARSESDLRDEAQATAEAFGELPGELGLLFRVATLRVRAAALGIRALRAQGGALHVRFDAVHPVDPQDLARAVRARRGSRLVAGGGLWNVPMEPDADPLVEAEAVLDALGAPPAFH